MASLSKRNGRFYLTFSDSSRWPSRKKVPLGPITAKAASRLKQRREDEYALRVYDPWDDSDGLTLKDAGAMLLRAKATKAGSTQKNYRDHVGWMCEYFGEDRPISTISGEDIEKYLRARNLNATSQKTYLTHAKVLFRFAYRKGWIDRVVTDDVEIATKPRATPRALSEDKLDAICKSIEDMVATNPSATRFGDPRWIIGVIRCNAIMGIRRTMLTRVRWKDVVLEDGIIHITGAKGGKSRIIPIVPQLQVHLDSMPRRTEWLVATSKSTKPVHPPYMSSMFKRYAKRAGINATFHDLRHTAATNLAVMGVPPEAIREYMGHSAYATTERYTKRAPGAYVETVRASFLRRQ